MSSDRGCSHCGRPVGGEGRLYCSSGCGLAARLPSSKDGLPASWQLGVALGVGFLLFNQWLFLGMEFLAQTRDRAVMADRFAVASVVCGSVAFLVNLGLFRIARPKRWTDVFAILAAIALPGLFLALSPDRSNEQFLFAFSMCNLLIGGWLGRSFLRRRL